MPEITREVGYLLLIFGLMVIPRILQRFRIPAPLSSFGLGLVAAIGLGASGQDETLSLLATLGISSLFLFAGLEIELDDFVRGKWPLLGHLMIRSATGISEALYGGLLIYAGTTTLLPSFVLSKPIAFDIPELPVASPSVPGRTPTDS
jgi:Kef-type K+ transport system membrane component KefB